MLNQDTLNQKARILYVDDDCELVDIYSRFFDNSDYLFKAAYNAEKGYEIAKHFIPDVIISDVAMPGMGGLDFCKKIRSDKNLEDVIFILVSGIDVEPEDILDGLGVGADDYLVKPFMRDILFAKIKSSLKYKRLKAALNQTEERVVELTNKKTLLENKLKSARKTLSGEKDLLVNSLRQITLMTEQDKRNSCEIENLQNLLGKSRENLTIILNKLIEASPQYHRGHSASVARISYEIALIMSMKEPEAQEIKTAALLHEIGKLLLPEALSLKHYSEHKPSEQDLLLQHPVKGALLLKSFPDFENISKIIRHIHESVDGRGFPDRLSGKKIPLGSKIIAVAGRFDNLVFRGKKESVENALCLLENDSGILFDAAVVNSLRRYLSRSPMEYGNNFIEMRIFEVKPGMKLAAGLYTMQGAKLLPENTVLTLENIEKISKYNKINLLDETVFIKE